MNWIFALGGLHGFFVTITILIVLYSDHRGLNYIRGREQILPAKFLHQSHKWVWTGLLLIITTGILLAIPSWEYRLQQGVFYAKMGLIFVLIMNALAIGKLSKHSGSISFAALLKEQKITLLVSGALSVIGWSGALIIGLYFL